VKCKGGFCSIDTFWAGVYICVGVSEIMVGLRVRQNLRLGYYRI
jgi:hypothetical protein